MKFEEDNDYFFPLWAEVIFTVFFTAIVIVFCKPCTLTIFIIWWILWEIGLYWFTRDGMPFAKNYKYIWWRRATVIIASFISFFLTKKIFVFTPSLIRRNGVKTE